MHEKLGQWLKPYLSAKSLKNEEMGPVSKRLGAKTGSEVPSKESALSQWSRS